MRFGASKYWWLTAAIIIGILNFWSILVEGTISEWLLFIWLFNINFFIYSVYNHGKLLIKRIEKPHDKSIVADFHYSINFLKLIAIIIYILSSLVDDLHDYIAWYIIVLLIIDTVLIIIRRKRVTADIS